MKVTVERMKAKCPKCGYIGCIDLHKKWDDNKASIHGPECNDRNKAVEGWFNTLIEAGV